MPKEIYVDVDHKKNQLLNTVAHLVSSYPTDAREGQWIYHLTNKSLCVCIDDTGDTTSPLAWKCSASAFDPIGIRDITCPEATDILDAVYISGDLTVALARSDAYATASVFGFVLSKESSTKCTVVTSGILDGFTGLTAGKQYFLSKQYYGGITDTVVTGTNSIIMRVGIAISATQLWINIDRSLTIRA